MYRDQTGVDINGKFHQHYLTALNNLTALCLEKAYLHDAVEALWKYVTFSLHLNGHFFQVDLGWLVPKCLDS